jgi:hypothetical protein
LFIRLFFLDTKQETSKGRYDGMRAKLNILLLLMPAFIMYVPFGSKKASEEPVVEIIRDIAIQTETESYFSCKYC